MLSRLTPDSADAVSAATPAWWLNGVAPYLGTDQAVAVVTAATIVSSPDLCARPLGELLPGLHGVRGGSPADFLESVRAWNLVKRQSANTWVDLADHSADRLGTWPNAGRKVVTEIVRGALAAWAAHDPATDVSPIADAHASVEFIHPREPPPLVPTSPPEQYIALRDLVGAAYRQGATNIGEALELAMASDVGRDAWQRLSAMPIPTMLGLGETADAAWANLLRFDERERRILAGRVFPVAAKLTLDELGRALDVTRERVRQIERHIKDQIESRITVGDSCAPIEHAAAAVRRSVGTITSEKALQAALAEQVDDDAGDAELRRAVLRELAGPYRAKGGFWQRNDALESLKATLLDRVDEPLTPEDVYELLASAGVVETSRDAVRVALPLHEFDERYLVWVGGPQDKACRVLQVHGEPMSREELHAAMGSKTVNFRSMVNAVQADDRFRRLGLNRYGLAAWGGEEYTTIADEIGQAIERRGGRADLNEIVDELVELFGVSAQSIRSYAASRRFHRDSDGALLVSPPDAASTEAAHMPAELDRDLVAWDGSWAVRLVIDRDVLRGSGRPTRSAIAQAAGVRPGDSRTIELVNGSAAISWRATQPAFGSTRALVEALGCAEGDYLFVPLKDGGSAHAVARSAVDEATGLRRIALELGIADSDDRPDRIAVAIGLDPTASVNDLRTRLRARRQDELAQQLPPDDSCDDDALEELMGFGE